MSRHTPVRLPSYTPLRESYSVSGAYRRKCSKCGDHKPMAGGKTYPGGKVWRCAECR